MDVLKSYIKSVGADEEPEMKDGDYIDRHGLMVCGKCGYRKQKAIELPFSDESVIVRCICKCEGEEITRRAEQEQNQKEMERIGRLKNASLMDGKYEAARFSVYEKDADNEKALKVAKNYVLHFEKMFADNQGIIFHGPVGTGKTFTAACIANELLDKGIPVVMTSFVKILQEIQKPDADEGAYLATLNRAKLLIIDDLGTERDTDYALEKVYNVVDSRVRTAKPVILTTNLSWDELTQEQDIRYRRIFDRILEVCYPVYVPGRSRRIRKAAKRMNDTKKLLEG